MRLMATLSLALATTLVCTLSLLAAEDPSTLSDNANRNRDGYAVIRDLNDRWIWDAGFWLHTGYQWGDNTAIAPGVLSGNFSSFLYHRTYGWGMVGYDNFRLYSRVVNEFRFQHNTSFHMMRFPDDLLVDNLFLEWLNVGGENLDLRIGRQDMILGSGRLVMDGTATDYGRTKYFDSIRLTWGLSPRNTVDIFGILQKPDVDWLYIGPSDYDQTSYEGRFVHNDMTEVGAGVYWSCQEFPCTPFELYTVWKDESRSFRHGNPNQRVPGRWFLAPGFRILPRFSPKLSGELEYSEQIGQTDDSRPIDARMVFASIGWQEIYVPTKPRLALEVIHYSGDHRSSAFENPDAEGRVTGWTPVFTRYTILSDITGGIHSGARWSNLTWPRINLQLTPEGGHKFYLMAGPMYADHNDTPDPSHNSLYMGTLVQAGVFWTILQPVHNGRGHLFFMLQADYMSYGNYFNQTCGECDGYYIFGLFFLKF